MPGLTKSNGMGLVKNIILSFRENLMGFNEN